MPSPFPCIPVIREYSWKKTQIEKKKLLCTFLVEIYYILSTTGGYQSANLVKFHLSSWKFWNLTGSKSFKFSGKKEQKSYLPWHGRVMQKVERKTNLWFQIWHEEFCEFLLNHSKVQKFCIDGLFLSKVYEVWTKEIQKS